MLALVPEYGDELAFPGDFSHAFHAIVDVKRERIFAHEVLVRGSLNEPAGYILAQVSAAAMATFDDLNRRSAIVMASRLGLAESISLNLRAADAARDGGASLMTLIEIAKMKGIEPKRLIFELSEADVIENVTGLNRALDRLRGAGASIAIDDFGAGYAGLNSLVTVNPDIIKLDMFLVRNINESGPRQATVRAIVALARELGIQVIAEGVERFAELRFLRRCGVELFQGYIFSKPRFEGIDKYSDLGIEQLA